MIRTDRLVHLELFREVSADALAKLAGIAIEHRFTTGDVIFRTGEKPRGWYVVLEGKVRVVRRGSSRQHVVHTERAGGTLGEVPLFAGGAHPATGIAAEPTVCGLFPRADLERLIATQPSIAMVLLARLARRVAALVERLHERSARSVHARLADFLLARHAAARSDTISIGMTQQELAEELGTVREVVSRELLALAAAGLVASRGGGRWVILDVDGLRRATK